MKVVAVNSSPGGNDGNTAIILNPFLEGMKEEDAEVKAYNLKDLNVKLCKSCVTCWFKTPTICCLDDDMKRLLPEIEEADILVFASPIYTDAVCAAMKNFMERLIPLVHPFIEIRGGKTRHVLRKGHKTDTKIVAVSSCGRYDNNNFDPMITHMKAFAETMGKEYAGTLTRAHAFCIRRPKLFEVSDIPIAAKEAGRQLIQTGKMSSDAVATVSRNIVPERDYIAIANKIYAEKAGGKSLD